MLKVIKTIKLLPARIITTVKTGAILYLLILILAAIFVGVIAVTGEFTLTLALILVVLLGLSLALVLIKGVQIKDLTIKKVILYLTIIAGFIGPAFLQIDIGPFSIFPFRVLLPILWLALLLGILINKGKLNISNIKVRHYLWFLALWLVYAVLSLAWAADKEGAIREIAFLFMGMSVIFFMVFYLRNLTDLKRVYNLWFVILLALVCIGLWEHTTGSHLSVSSIIDIPARFKYNPTGVFHNQNDYATYLALSFPFVLAFIRHNSQLLKRLFGVAILIIVLYLVVVTFSRANYLAVILGLAFWFLFLLKAGSKLKVLVAAGVAALLLFLIFPSQLQDALGTIGEQLRSLTTPTGLESGGVGIRIGLIKNSLVFLVDSAGFGVGAGNVEYYMAAVPVYETGAILNVHNWWAQILANYGVFIFVGYILFYLGLLWRLYRLYAKLTDNSEKIMGEALLVGLVVFFFASMSSSSIIALGAQWIFFGFALGFLNYCRINKVGDRV
ncbi:MAG: O-antigen ligase family protein [Dehalococcoidia bacterium]|jgi:teichuronic acid biosynthesis protein TuaE